MVLDSVPMGLNVSADAIHYPRVRIFRQRRYPRGLFHADRANRLGTAHASRKDDSSMSKELQAYHPGREAALMSISVADEEVRCIEHSCGQAA